MSFTAAMKAKARAALQQHWQTALLIALIVNLPMLLAQGLAAFTGNELGTRLQDLLVRASAGSVSANALTDEIAALLSESGILSMALLSVLAWLVTPVLSVGMIHWILDRLRGEEEPVSTVFSRLGIFLKSIGLRLLISLKILLWMLPGIAVSALSLLPLLNARSQSREEILSAANTSTVLLYLGMLVMLVLGVMGYLYYAMADFVLADEPEERVLSCARRSKSMMKHRRGALLTLMFSFLLWYLLIYVAVWFIGGIAGSVMALMLEMLGSLFLSVYMLTTQGVFYEELRSAPVQEIPAES